MTKEIVEMTKRDPRPAPKPDADRWRLDEFPEARHHNEQARANRYLRNILIGATGAGAIGTAATLPLIRHMSSPMTTLAGSALDSPALMLLGLGPAAVPLGVGAATVGTGFLASEANRQMNRRKKLLNANYRQDRPAMSQESTTDDWTGPDKDQWREDTWDVGQMPPIGSRGSTGSW